MNLVTNNKIDYQWLSQHICSQPGILKNRNNPLNLEKLDKEGFLVKEFVGDQLAGITAIWKTQNPLWFEIGSTVVFEDYRNNGLLKSLYKQVLKVLRDKNINGFLISNHRSIIEISKRSIEDGGLGWEETDIEWIGNVFKILTQDKELNENNSLCLKHRLDLTEYKGSLLFVQPKNCHE